jgi:hypothetical protein
LKTPTLDFVAMASVPWPFFKTRIRGFYVILIQKPSKNPSKTILKSWTNRCKNHVVFRCRFFRVLVTIWEALGLQNCTKMSSKRHQHCGADHFWSSKTCFIFWPSFGRPQGSIWDDLVTTLGDFLKVWWYLWWFFRSFWRTWAPIAWHKLCNDWHQALAWLCWTPFAFPQCYGCVTFMCAGVRQLNVMNNQHKSDPEMQTFPIMLH